MINIVARSESLQAMVTSFAEGIFTPQALGTCSCKGTKRGRKTGKPPRPGLYSLGVDAMFRE
jgi:hypothetical protein